MIVSKSTADHSALRTALEANAGLDELNHIVITLVDGELSTTSSELDSKAGT